MNDEEYFEQLCSNSVDGTLTDSEREKLEAHLAECPSCAALLRDLREMRALFAQEAEAPDSLHDGIMEQLRQETKLHVVQPEKPVRRMPVFTMVGVAAATPTMVNTGGISGRAISDGDSAGIVPAEDTGALTLPEAVRGLRIAHCYIADGGELPEPDGKLLYSDSSAAWFQLDNNMSTLQNTLNALEKSGCTVTAYEDIGLTLDSRADSWLLIVRN